MKRLNVISYIGDLFRGKLLFPGRHTFGRHTVFDGFEQVIDFAAMQPVIIRQVWPNVSLGMIAVTGRTGAFENGLTLRQYGRIMNQFYRVFIYPVSLLA